MAIEICTTTGNEAEAKKIARATVEGGLCACAHIDQIESVYRWQGECVSDTEYRLTLKCSDEAYEAVKDVILANHSYEEPALYVLPIVNGSSSYLTWIKQNSV